MMILTQVNGSFPAALIVDRCMERVCRCRDPTPMTEDPTWEPIASAPFDSDLELAVVEGWRVHALVFACRRTTGGWVRASNRERVIVSPTHWRLWAGETKS